MARSKGRVGGLSPRPKAPGGPTVNPPPRPGPNPPPDPGILRPPRPGGPKNGLREVPLFCFCEGSGKIIARTKLNQPCPRSCTELRKWARDQRFPKKPPKVVIPTPKPRVKFVDICINPETLEVRPRTGDSCPDGWMTAEEFLRSKGG